MITLEGTPRSTKLIGQASLRAGNPELISGDVPRECDAAIRYPSLPMGTGQPARSIIWVATAALFCISPLAQVAPRSATLPAATDPFSTETGGFMLAIPGVADDFVLFADGQWQERGDGSVRLSAYVQRAAAIDRDFYLELVFAGRIDPGAPNHPPIGSPVTTLLPAAYQPTGPVDPSTYTYFTQVTGTMTGLRAFAGAQIDLAAASTAQVGLGAANKSAALSLAADLNLTVVQMPTGNAFAPTGPAQLRTDFADQLAMCATHVDTDPNLRSGSARLAFDLGGVTSDYIFMPSASLIEANDGTATLTGLLKSQSNYADAWQLQLQLDQRVDPGDASYPPANLPNLQLLPSSYASGGGPIDPAQWRYYTQVTGTLTGLDQNDQGQLQLTVQDGVQIGVGAGQGNVFFSLYAEFAVTVTQQPTGTTLPLTGAATLNASVARTCILPPPMVLTGDAQTIDSVTQTTLTFTGTDLGFVNIGAIGSNLFGTNERQWLTGHIKVVDHSTLEMSIPQGLPGANYPLRFLNPVRASNQLSVNIQEPTSITVQTEPNRLGGEDQHWVTHSGTTPAPSIALVCISFSNLPSVAPGIVNMQIGNQFQNLLMLGAVVQDPISNVSMFTLPNLDPGLAGNMSYTQVALMGIPTFPLATSNVTTTSY